MYSWPQTPPFGLIPPQIPSVIRKIHHKPIKRDQKITFDRMDMHTPNINPWSRELLPDWERELKLAWSNVNMEKLWEDPAAVPLEINIHYPPVKFTSYATNLPDLAQEYTRYITGMVADEVNRLSREARAHKDRTGAWPWGDAAVPQIDYIEEVLPFSTHLPFELTPMLTPEGQAAGSGAAEDGPAGAGFNRQQESDNRISTDQNKYPDNTGTNSPEPQADVCMEMLSETSRTALKLMDELPVIMRKILPDFLNGLQALTDFFTPREAQAEDLRAGKTQAKEPPAMEPQEEEPGAEGLGSADALPAILNELSQTAESAGYAAVAGKGILVRTYDPPLPGKTKFAVFKLRDSQSSLDDMRPENAVHIDDFDFAYDQISFKSPWEGQTRVDFSDTETLKVLLRRDNLTPAQKMILNYQFAKAMQVESYVLWDQELQELLKGSPPSQWDEDTLAAFTESIKGAESFIGKAKRLRKGDGEREHGYTVGYGAYIPLHPNTKGEYTQSAKMEEIIKDTLRDHEKGLTNIEITEEQALTILKELIKAKIDDAQRNIPLLPYLDKTRQRVILDLTYNPGINKLMGFKEMLKHLHNNNMREAGWELLNSSYSTDVRGRSLYNALTLASGRNDLSLESYKTLWNTEKWSNKSREQLKEAYYQELDKL